MSTAAEKPVPAYIPWETFTEFLAHLKATAVPSRIDKSVMPQGMASLTRGQIQSALKFLGLIDSSGTTRDMLRTLVAAYETDGWQDALREFIATPYLDILGELDLDNAMQQQLDERFKQAGVGGQMLLKSVRFYLAGLTAAGLSFSPHLAARRVRSVGNRKKSPAPKQLGAKPDPVKTSMPFKEHRRDEHFVPEGMRKWPLYFNGKPDGTIIVPADLSPADCKMIELQIAVLKASAGVDE